MGGRDSTSCLMPRFTEALVYATTLHEDQCRKGMSIPYINRRYSFFEVVFEP